MVILSDCYIAVMLYWLTVFSHSWPTTPSPNLPLTCVVCLRGNKGRCHVFVCLWYVHFKERIHFQLSSSAFKTSSQMCFIWRGALKQIPSQFECKDLCVCLLGPSFLLAQCFGPSCTLNHPPLLLSIYPFFTLLIIYTCIYCTLWILDLTGCVVYSNILTQKFKMSFKTYWMVLWLVLFFQC